MGMGRGRENPNSPPPAGRNFKDRGGRELLVLREFGLILLLQKSLLFNGRNSRGGGFMGKSLDLDFQIWNCRGQPEPPPKRLLEIKVCLHVSGLWTWVEVK